ncbi:MAG: TonB-dependent receptor [Opitutales bacterium]
MISRFTASIRGWGRGRLLRRCFTLALLGLLPAWAAAQDTGIVTGRVFDATGDRYIEGAFVRVTDLGNVSATTDLEGRYVIRQVPAGEHTVSVSYVGYTGETRNITVPAGGTASADFTLSSDIIELEEFVATADWLSGQARAVNLQRSGSGIRNVVNEEVFGQMNDGNIGIAISRMPGLTVDTDGSTEVQRYVNIRGFDSSLNSVQLDGNRLSTSGSGSPGRRGRGTAYGGSARGFALDDIPADAITNVEITKAPTPDMDGDALGGTVNLVTKNAFQYDSRFMKLRAAGDYSKRRDNWGSNVAFTYAEPFMVQGAEQPNLGVTVNLSYYDQNEGFDNLDTDNQWISTSTDGLVVGARGDDNQDIDSFYLDGPANDYLAGSLSASLQSMAPDQVVVGYVEDIEANNYNIRRERYGANVSFDYKLNDETELYLKTTYSTETRDSDDFRHHTIMNNDHFDQEDPIDQYVSPFADDDPNYDAGNWEVFSDAGWEDEIRPGEAYDLDGDGTAETVFNPGALVRPSGFGSDVVATIRPGLTVEQGGTFYEVDGDPRGRVGYEGTFRFRDIDLSNFNIGGKTRTDWGEIKYDAYWSRSSQDYTEYEQEWRRDGFQFEYSRPFQDPWYIDYDTVNSDEADRFAVPDQNSESAFFEDELEWKTFDQEENVIGLSTDVTWDIPENLAFGGFLKTGFQYRRLNREYDYDEREWDFDEDTFPFADYLIGPDNYPYDPVNPERPRDDGAQAVPYVPNTLKIVQDFLLGDNPPAFIEGDGEVESNILDSVEQDYDATETSYAGYLMGQFRTGDLTIIAGARYEYVDFEQEAFLIPDEIDNLVDPDLTVSQIFNIENNFETFTSGNSYNEFLPSIHLRYDFLDGKLVTRVSWGRTYARPAMKDMVGSVFSEFDDEGNQDLFVNVPNPQLPTQQSENYDISIEYYTDNGGYFQIAYFRKDMTNYAFQQNRSVTLRQYREEGSPFGPAPDETNRVIISQPTANTPAVNSGIELVAQQQLTFLPSPFDGFKINANATFADSEADYQFGSTGPTVGHSDYMYNLALEFSKWNFFGRAKWSYRHHFFENVSVSDLGPEIDEVPAQFQFLGDDTFMNPGRLDLEAAYTFNVNNKPVTVFCNVTNVLEQMNASRQGYWNYLDDAYPKLRRWNVGIEAEF